MTTEAKHTPGPWVAIEDAHIVMSGDNAVASTWKFEGVIRDVGGRGDADEARANARLIAAAPELLEALKAMVASVDRAKGRPVTFHEGVSRCSVTVARAAIAKATGTED